MKTARLAVLLLLLVISLVACQKSTEGGNITATEAPGSTGPYPDTGQLAANEASVYPAPSSAAQASIPISVYPELKDGDMIEWDRVAGAIYSGLVASVSQKHDLQVSITFKDGRTFVSTEPAIDDIIKIVQQCGDPCKDIKIVTE